MNKENYTKYDYDSFLPDMEYKVVTLEEINNKILEHLNIDKAISSNEIIVLQENDTITIKPESFDKYKELQEYYLMSYSVEENEELNTKENRSELFFLLLSNCFSDSRFFLDEYFIEDNEITLVMKEEDYHLY